MSSWFRHIAIAPCLLLLACDPAQDPENPTGVAPAEPLPQHPNGDAVSMPYCKRVEQVLPNADTPVGALVPRKIALKASASSRGRWIEHPNANNPFVQQAIVPSAHEAPGEVRVSYANGAIRFIQSVFVNCTPGVACADIGVSCVDSIEIDMQVEFTSDNGVFSEQRTGTLSIPDPRDPDHHTVEPEEENNEPVPELPRELKIRAPIDPIAFSGSATLQTTSIRPGFSLVSNTLSFAVTIEDQKLTHAGLGSLVEVQQDPLPGSDGASMGAGSETLYRFEPDPSPTRKDSIN